MLLLPGKFAHFARKWSLCSGSGNTQELPGMALDFSKYDMRHYETVSVLEGYGRWSKNYDAYFDDALDRELFERITCIDWKSIRSAVDLGCGTGRTGAWLRLQGVGAVDGVDITPEMMVRAKNRGVYRRLQNEDIRRTSLAAHDYDLAINSLSAEHLPALSPLFEEAERLVCSNGYLVILGYHPHFQLRGIPTHFDDADSNVSVAIDNYIHLLSDFVKTGAAGWTLIWLDEQVVHPEWVARSPGMAKHLGHPVSFLGVWRKAS
jgi:SAM-dependent methyltransferase